MFGISPVALLTMAVGTLVAAGWLILYQRGQKYQEMFEGLDEKEFPLKELYGLGYSAVELSHYQFKSKSDRKLRQALSILYDEKYTEFYLRVIYAEKVTIALTLIAFAFPMYGLSNEIAILVLFLMFAGLAYYYYGTLTEKRIEKRSDELLHDFSEVVSKLALLINAGMILRDSWQMIAEEGEGVIYDEMRTAVIDMNNGVSEVDAIYNFGSRCVTPEIKKFAGTIIQGLNKGNRELSQMLTEQNKEVWELKKHLARRQGEKAASKLLIPISIMFIGILIMIIVPIFSNIGV